MDKLTDKLMLENEEFRDEFVELVNSRTILGETVKHALEQLTDLSYDKVLKRILKYYYFDKKEKIYKKRPEKLNNLNETNIDISNAKKITKNEMQFVNKTKIIIENLENSLNDFTFLKQEKKILYMLEKNLISCVQRKGEEINLNLSKEIVESIDQILNQLSPNYELTKNDLINMALKEFIEKYADKNN